MYPVWSDANLPKNILSDGFGYSPSSGVIRSESDAGYPKIRRRFTAVTKQYTVSFSFTMEQFDNFESFFNNPPTHVTIQGISMGSLPFYFPQPIWYPGVGETEDDRPETRLYRMVHSVGSPPYNVSQESASSVTVSFTLEELP